MPQQYRCPGCGATELQVLAWVDGATDQMLDWAEPYDFWCPECEEHFKDVDVDEVPE